jgi:hypothetical protein
MGGISHISWEVQALWRSDTMSRRPRESAHSLPSSLQIYTMERENAREDGQVGKIEGAHFLGKWSSKRGVAHQLWCTVCRSGCLKMHCYLFLPHAQSRRYKMDSWPGSAGFLHLRPGIAVIEGLIFWPPECINFSVRPGYAVFNGQVIPGVSFVLAD